jgi:hypothetical protein
MLATPSRHEIVEFRSEIESLLEASGIHKNTDPGGWLKNVSSYNTIKPAELDAPLGLIIRFAVSNPAQARSSDPGMRIEFHKDSISVEKLNLRPTDGRPGSSTQLMSAEPAETIPYTETEKVFDRIARSSDGQVGFVLVMSSDTPDSVIAAMEAHLAR